MRYRELYMAKTPESVIAEQVAPKDRCQRHTSTRHLEAIDCPLNRPTTITRNDKGWVRLFYANPSSAR